MVSINFTIDKDVNFYFYLMNLYAYDLTEADLEFRSKYKYLRSQDFAKLFERLENPFIKEKLNVSGISDTDLALLDTERRKFESIWPIYEKQAQELKECIESASDKILNIFTKCLEITRMTVAHDVLEVRMVPFLKPHGKQDTSNFVYLSKKDELSLDDYIFVIVHELLHIVVYDFISKYYFKYNYSDEMHMIEEVMINFIYFEAVKSQAEHQIVPRWLYLNDGETYDMFFTLSPLLGELVDKGLTAFVDSAIQLLDIDDEN